MECKELRLNIAELESNAQDLHAEYEDNLAQLERENERLRDDETAERERSEIVIATLKEVGSFVVWRLDLRRPLRRRISESGHFER